MALFNHAIYLINVKQIKRWLNYQYMRDSKGVSTKSGAVDPYQSLLNQLTGRSEKAPRAKTGVSLWRKTCSEEIEKEVTCRAIRDKVDRKKLAPMREKVVNELFRALSQEEKDDWIASAKEENEAEGMKWKEEKDAPPSTCPADRQRCEVFPYLCSC